MLTVILMILNFTVAGLGIYLFDYRVDNSINSPLIIILSLVIGWIVFFGVLWIYIELFYKLVAKKQPQTSMRKHKIAKQMVSVPMHLTNMRVDVVGLDNLPKDPGFSIYANHTSMLDIPVLMYKLNYKTDFFLKSAFLFV